MRKKFERKRGFTLIELLVVIAIIAILAAILFPVFLEAKRKGQESTCKSNLKQLAEAFQFYIDDNGAFPDQSLIPLFPYGTPYSAGVGSQWIQQFSHRYRTDDGGAPAGFAKPLLTYCRNAGLYKCPGEGPDGSGWLPYVCGSSYFVKHALGVHANAFKQPVKPSLAKYPSKCALLCEAAWHGPDRVPLWSWNVNPSTRKPFVPVGAVFMDTHVGRIDVPWYEKSAYDANWFLYSGSSNNKNDFDYNWHPENGDRDIL